MDKQFSVGDGRPTPAVDAGGPILAVGGGGGPIPVVDGGGPIPAVDGGEPIPDVSGGGPIPAVGGGRPIPAVDGGPISVPDAGLGVALPAEGNFHDGSIPLYLLNNGLASLPVANVPRIEPRVASPLSAMEPRRSPSTLFPPWQPRGSSQTEATLGSFVRSTVPMFTKTRNTATWTPFG